MIEELAQNFDFIVLQTKQNIEILLYIILLLWSCFFLTTLIPKFLYLGIIPRKAFGLCGIIFAPFLHANFNHLFFNSIPLVVLSNFILIQGFNYFIAVSVLIILISGFLTWCFGKSGIHVGASSVITGYWALLVSNIFQQGTIIALILGGVSLYYFAGIFLGIFPSKKGVSWEGHLFGLIAGIIVAYTPETILYCQKILYNFAPKLI
jgi:membrane associated rhomboid family serine protease